MRGALICLLAVLGYGRLSFQVRDKVTSRHVGVAVAVRDDRPGLRPSGRVLVEAVEGPISLVVLQRSEGEAVVTELSCLGPLGTLVTRSNDGLHGLHVVVGDVTLTAQPEADGVQVVVWSDRVLPLLRAHSMVLGPARLQFFPVYGPGGAPAGLGLSVFPDPLATTAPVVPSAAPQVGADAEAEMSALLARIQGRKPPPPPVVAPAPAPAPVDTPLESRPGVSVIRAKLLAEQKHRAAAPSDDAALLARVRASLQKAKEVINAPLQRASRSAVRLADQMSVLSTADQEKELEEDIRAADSKDAATRHPSTTTDEEGSEADVKRAFGAVKSLHRQLLLRKRRHHEHSKRHRKEEEEHAPQQKPPHGKVAKLVMRSDEMMDMELAGGIQQVQGQSKAARAIARAKRRLARRNRRKKRLARRAERRRLRLQKREKRWAHRRLAHAQEEKVDSDAGKDLAVVQAEEPVLFQHKVHHHHIDPDVEA